MSVLIKGMETPKSCGKCKLFDASHAIGLFPPLGWCRVNGKEIFRLSEKADFCPLVPIPEPHGRLGDLDELYDHLNEWYLTHEHGFFGNEKIYIRAMRLGVKDAPTIIPASEEGKT